VKPVQAVDIADLYPVFSQDGGKGQKTQGFCPEIEGCKIMDPGIDTQDMGRISLQNNSWMFFSALSC
jgi:hypothetical protein